MRPRILLAMIEAGGGHRAPAVAVRDALEQRHPGRFDIDVLDFMHAVGDERFDRRHKASWRWMLAHPDTTYRAQRLLDDVLPVTLTRALQGAALSGHVGRAAAFVRGGRYDVAVCSHFLPLQALALARRRELLTLPLYGIVSDPFDGHALWAEPNADALFVGSDDSRRLLREKGVPDDRLVVTGYPLGLRFLAPRLPREELRAALDLEPGRLTVLQSVGGEGLGGGLDRFVQAVMAADLPLEYVVVCGRNRELEARLGRLAAAAQGRTRLIVKGFVTDMEHWLAAADLVLGKAGAASTLEPLALGTPVVHTSFVSTNERRNIDHCREHGIGVYADTPDRVVALLREFLAQPERLATLRDRVAAYELPIGTYEIAERIATPLLAGRGGTGGA